MGNTKSENNKKLLSAIAQKSGIEKNVMTDASNVRADILSDSVLVVCNNNRQSTDIAVKVDGKELTDIITGEKIEIREGVVNLSIAKEDCNCYIIS